MTSSAQKVAAAMSRKGQSHALALGGPTSRRPSRALLENWIYQKIDSNQFLLSNGSNFLNLRTKNFDIREKYISEKLVQSEYSEPKSAFEVPVG